MADRSARILLVDDEHSIQTLLSYPLSKDGYEVVRASEGILFANSRSGAKSVLLSPGR